MYDRFAPYYDVVYNPVVDYDGDARWLEEAFARFASRPVRRVLDMGCGTGNHAVRLARRGFQVDGIDVSDGLLALARNKASREPRDVAARLAFHAGDMSATLPAGPFDAVACMFGAFNYVEDDASTARMLALVRDRLAPGGVFCFEFWNPIGVDPGSRWDRSRDGDLEVVRLFRSVFEAAADVVRLEMDVLVLRGGALAERFQETHRLRTRTPARIRAMVADAGLEALAFTVGERDGKSFDPAARDAFRVMCVARAP